jgi:hypothetical protein
MWKLCLVLSVVACNDDKIHHLPDAPCSTSGMVTMAVTTPPAFGCHDRFMSTLVMANGTCEDITVNSIAFSGVVTTGQCSPPAPGTAIPMTKTVSAGATTDVLDFNANPFCCISPGCPASFQCDEAYTWVADTSAGSITGMSMAHLSLDSCNQICP